MKIYTKHGDKGTTLLFGGKRVSKNDVRIAAVGEVDELNAAIGLAVAAAEAHGELAGPLTRVQSELFDLGANLATPPEADRHHIPPITEDHVQRIEREIDSAEEHLPPLRTFILPAGSEAAARLHLARAVCRRAERAAVTLHESEPIDQLLLQYLNRLADYLFVLARRANQLNEIEDKPWTPTKPGS